MASSSACAFVLRRVYAGRGVAYKENGDDEKASAGFDKVIAYFSKAIRRKLNEPYVYLFRCEAYSGKGDHDKAITDYNKAIPDYS